MHAQSIPSPDTLSPGDKRLIEARQDLLPQLQPLEYLKITVPGMVGAPSILVRLINILLTLATTTPVVVSKAGQPVYLAVTENDLLLASTDPLHKPLDVRRIPLSQVRLMQHTEGLLTDELVLETGGVKPIRVNVGHPYRQGTRQLASYLPRTRQSTGEPTHPAEKPAVQSYSPVTAQMSALNQMITQHGAIKASTYLSQAGISALAILAGYAIGFGLLHPYFTGNDPLVNDIVNNIFIYAICCLPSVIPVAISLAAVVVLIQSRLKFSAPTARWIVSLTSLVLGVIIYIPFQLLLLIGAAL